MKWSAGKYAEEYGEESYKKNPWLFRSNHTFVTERDGHHGEWVIKDCGGRYELQMHWKNHEGFAIFQFNHLHTHGFDPKG